MSSTRNMEDGFLGSLLGLAIGDALGMPVGDVPVSQTRERFGTIDGYRIRHEGAEDEIPTGEITDETETVLCIVESMTTNNGMIDPEIVNARLMYLVEGASKHWMPPEMRDGIRLAREHDGLVPESDEPDASLAVAVRGVPIGLMHSVGGFDRDAFLRGTELVTRLSHGGTNQHQLVIDVALGIVGLLRDESPEPIELDIEGERVAALRGVIANLIAGAHGDKPFEDLVFGAVNELRPADSAGALAGTFAGANQGASRIPQFLIDGLGARVYLSLAAPWFYRTAVRRAGTLIDLRQV